jgi:hypothetical protein
MPTAHEGVLFKAGGGLWCFDQKAAVAKMSFEKVYRGDIIL